VAEGCEQIAAMPDPVGEITGVKRRPSGISVGQMRVPLGVFGMIYESRPNVTIEAASAGHQERQRLHPARRLRGHAVQPGAVALVQAGAGRGRPAARRGATGADHRPRRRGPLITMPEYVDVIIPRGGKGLIERISRRGQACR
jgi:glutamate-5-semialdehyde dehydrogenase